MAIDIRALGPGDEDQVHAAADLFDDPPQPEATRRFLAEPTHHLLLATDADGNAVGFVTGVETTHPDKGTELFLYELGVAEEARRRGIGRALTEAMAELARERGCHGMWVGTEPDNVAARRTYEAAGARPAAPAVVLEWEL